MDNSQSSAVPPISPELASISPHSGSPPIQHPRAVAAPVANAVLPLDARPHVLAAPDATASRNSDFRALHARPAPPAPVAPAQPNPPWFRRSVRQTPACPPEPAKSCRRPNAQCSSILLRGGRGPL